MGGGGKFFRRQIGRDEGVVKFLIWQRENDITTKLVRNVKYTEKINFLGYNF